MNTTIESSFSGGSVTCRDTIAGGLAGHIREGSVIRHSYFTASVASEGWGAVGGLVYENGTSANIVSCYASGDVRGANVVGGLVGVNYCVVMDSYASGNIVVLGW